MKKSRKYYLRKLHRWLAVVIGVQFLVWTVSGIYFSWTDIDEIHGDQFLSPGVSMTTLKSLALPESQLMVSELAVRFIDDRPFLWVNNATLIDPETGEVKPGVSREEAEKIARQNIKDDYDLSSIALLESVGPHHEYRGRSLPVWVVKFEGPTDLTAYVAQRDGSFQRVRHTSWRVFDFLWMLHTMDFKSRDDFNNLLLRLSSAFALIVVASGFILFFVSRLKSRPETGLN